MSPTRKRSNLLALAALALLALVYFASRAKADDHMMHHPPQDMLLHEKFYSTWNQHSGASCCNLGDCYPTKAVFDKDIGLWKAERREDHKMILIPKSVYDPERPEIERESPDGQSHMCAPRPMKEAYWKQLMQNYSTQQYSRNYSQYIPREVYCFTPGAGN